MNAAVMTASSTLRQHQGIIALFAEAQGRHLNDAEQERYLALAPDASSRLTAARDLMRNEALVVRGTVKDILRIYPFQAYHDRGPDKCIRDVQLTSIYCTQAMLQNDMDWYRDKFLYWMRTMIQAFDFPARDEIATGTDAAFVNPFPEITRQADTKPSHVASIFDTYSRLARKYQQILQPKSWALLEAPFELTVDVLCATH